MLPLRPRCRIASARELSRAAGAWRRDSAMPTPGLMADVSRVKQTCISVNTKRGVERRGGKASTLMNA